MAGVWLVLMVSTFTVSAVGPLVTTALLVSPLNVATQYSEIGRASCREGDVAVPVAPLLLIVAVSVWRTVLAFCTGVDFFQADVSIRVEFVTGIHTSALPILIDWPT